MNSGKMDDSIEMPLGVVGRVGPRNHVLDEVQLPMVRDKFFFGGGRGNPWCNVMYKKATWPLPKLVSFIYFVGSKHHQILSMYSRVTFHCQNKKYKVVLLNF